ncbi:uncharacterized protein LOC120413947 [Culex pipiens pallens]|uniref:uncharacterized protein LOC120413947 n=1 Tax=Culex pipiens pallens TaxID=42434 RepID=UPI0019543E6A|nr:uncharacterized protein LOC120413947 [Culex pipiens pallens]
MKRNDTREGNSTATTVYRILQSPAPICMFYFAHPFGISSPATVSTSSKSVTTTKQPPPAPAATTKSEQNRKPVPLPAPKYQEQRQPSKTEIVRQRPDTRDGGGGGGGTNAPVGPKKTNGMTAVRPEKVVPPPKVTTPGPKPGENRGKLKRSKHCTNVSSSVADPAAKAPVPLTVKPHAKTKKRSNVIELDHRQTHLTPWPSTIWNRDFLIPPLLQVLAKQHGRKIPDIEQILRTVRSAWNTPKSQRSLLQSQDSRDSSASNWDLSSSCDSHYCDQGRHYARMGAGTYATVMGGPGPGLLRRRYSVPEIIMRKHTLAQQKPTAEELLLCDTNHNTIGAANKNSSCYQSPCHSTPSPQPGRGPLTRASSKQGSPVPATPPPRSQHRKSITRAASSVDGGGAGGNHVATTAGPPSPLISTGSESNLAAMKQQQQLRQGGISRNQKCSSVNGINSSTGGVNGVGGALGGGVGSGADFSMRKSTLLRRMWSKEMRRYDRSGSWSPPLRRAPRRIYSIESILPPDGLLGGDGGSGASSDGSSCVTTSATSCKECAKLESQYNGNARTGKLVAQESPKRLRLAASLNNINNNLQKVDFVEGAEEEGLSCGSTPNRNLISSEGLGDDSVSVATTKSSKPEVSSTTGTTASTPLIRARKHTEKTTSKSRGFVFMSGAATIAPASPSCDVELDEADLTSSTSSIASQACARPVGGLTAGSTGTILEATEEGTLIDNEDDDGASTILNGQDNESELSEFLHAEAQSQNDCQDPVAGGVQRNRDSDAYVHPRERDKTAGRDAPPGQTDAVKVTAAGQFPLKKKQSRRGSNASSSALSAVDSSTDSESVYNGAKNDDRLDEYISNLLVDNLNNLLDNAREVVTVVAGSAVDQKNNNKVVEVEPKSIEQVEVVAAEPSEMKQKSEGKYIGGGGGVVCNSPPDPGSKLKHQLSKDKDSEKENEDTINNNQGTTTNGKVNINYVRKKNGFGEKKPNANGFYLVSKNGSRDSDGLPSEIDLNGKYYFPTYGVETDPSDHTDIASEPEVQIMGKIGTGSIYRENVNGRYGIVPRISALPRTESMEVQPSSTSAEEEFDELLERNGGSDSDTPSLVDSLDEVEVAPRRPRKKSLATPSPAPAEPSAAETTTKTESTTSSDKSPRHEKGEAFFVPIQDPHVIIDEHIVVADAMPLRIKERLNNRQRLMIWRKEQESLKKHRKLMRMIEQKKFYGEPAIHVISTIDRAISRKEFIPPSEKKRVFGQTAGPFTPKVNKTKKKNSALRTELGMLESYKIDARGNMQIQNPAAASPSGATTSGKKVAKSPWGQAAERRQTKVVTTEVYAAPTPSAKSSLQTATTSASSSKTPKKTPIDPRRKQVLKDVQQMTLYQQPDLTPDIERGPRRMYQKTEIQEGDKHIEILEIVECADSAPGTAAYHRRAPRVRSAGNRSAKRSRIPVPIYKWGLYRRNNYSRENSPLTGAGSNPKVDRMIADLLIEALSNPDDVGVKFIKSPEELKEKTKRSPNNRKTNPSNNATTPRRSANSGKYTQRFEVIPEERSSVSVGSSTEELSANRKKHASPRRVSFEENHKILNLDEFQPPKATTTTTTLSPKMAATSPKPSPKPSPSKSTAAKPATSTSPKAPALKKNTTTTTTSRGKAAIQSEVVEEKGWIGFTTQHEDLATPVNGGGVGDGGEEDEVQNRALFVHIIFHTNLAAHARSRKNLVKTIITGNTARHDHVVDHFHHHQSVNIAVGATATVATADVRRTLTAGSVTSVDRIRSTVATVGSGDLHDSGSVANHLAITATRRLTSGEFSDESCFTDSLNTKPSPMRKVREQLTNPEHEYKSTAESVKEVTNANVENHHCDCSESILPYRQIREENAWHVYESGDCKVIQSKIEYYETSIHRTPLTENAQGLFGHLADRTPESLRSALMRTNFDNMELVRHEPARVDEGRLHPTSSDTLDSRHIPAIPALRTPALSEEPPKTSETCSSCCFCNPELHKHNGNPPDSCFYCQAKAHTPSKHFPAPPTPPNIQMSPIPPSPKTPIFELTPTPTLQEIPLPSKKNPEPQPSTPKPDNPSETASGENIPGTSTTTTTSTSINGLYTETTKKTDHTHTKTKTKTSDTVSTKCSKTNEKIKRSYVPSTGPDSEHPLEELSKKLTRKKSETTVLNRPKNINNLHRPPTVVHTVQKEVKNELKTPIKVLPKTAKEFSNRKERDKQITLNLPLDHEPPPPPKQPTEKSKTTLGFENLHRPPKDPKTRCASSQSYDETTTSSSSTDTSPNSSPFKKCTAANGSTPLQPAASRWKHNSERNLTQLTMQKITTASKWGNKWRKAARQHEHSPAPPSGHQQRGDSGLSPVRSNGASGQMGAGTSAATATTMTQAASVAAIAPSSIVGGISQSTSNQGWTVTVAGNYNPDMAPDVEMRLSFPKQQTQVNGTGANGALLGNGGSPARRGASGKRAPANGHPSPVNGHGAMNGHDTRTKQYIEDTHHIPGRGGQNYALLDDDSYVGGGNGRGNGGRAALPPPPPQPGLNPKRTLSRADGHAGGGGKDYRLPNVGTSNNVPGRQTTKKGIKVTMAIVASATTRTVAKNYHMLSHQHEHQQQQQHHFQPAMLPSSPNYPYYHHQQHQQSLLAAAGQGPPPGTTTTTMTSMTTGGARGGGGGGGRQRASSFQSLHHPSLQNGHGGVGGGKYPPSNSHQPRCHDPSSVIDYGSNAFYGGRRMSLDSPHGMVGADLSVMGNAIAPEHKPKVPTMSERDLTRRHNPCYTRNQPYFS